MKSFSISDIFLKIVSSFISSFLDETMTSGKKILCVNKILSHSKSLSDANDAAAPVAQLVNRPERMSLKVVQLNWHEFES